MGAKSTFSKLPPELIKKFHALVADDEFTHQQIVDYLNVYLKEIGEKQTITKRIVQYNAQNYKANLAKVGEQLRLERQVSEEMMAQIGTTPNTGQSQLLSALIQSMATKIGMDMKDSENIDPKDLKNLAHTKQIIDRSDQITQNIITQVEAEIAKKMAAAMKAKGIDEETIRTIEMVIVRD